MFVLTLFNAAINFAATIIFSIAGCMMVEDKPLMKAMLPAMLCSFAGGLTRDALLWLIVSRDVMPAFLSAYDLWIAAAIGFLYFALMKWRNTTWVLNRGWHKWLRTAIDYAGVGQFLVAGISRAREFGVTDPVALTLFGTMTALGGGLISLALFRENKKKALLSNIIYYLTALAPSAVVANITGYRVAIAPVAALTALFCSVVGVSALYVLSSECAPRRIKRDPAFMQKIRLQLSVGALFHAVLHPRKGIRCLIHVPSAAGAKPECLVLPVAV